MTAAHDVGRQRQNLKEKISPAHSESKIETRSRSRRWNPEAQQKGVFR